MLKKYFFPFYIFTCFFALFLLGMSSVFGLALGKNFFYLYYIVLIPVIDRLIDTLSADFSFGVVSDLKRGFFALLGFFSIISFLYYLGISQLYVFFIASFFFFWYLKVDTRIYFIGGFFCLLSLICFLLMKDSALAEQYSILLYLSLVSGTLLSLTGNDNRTDHE